MYNCYNEAYQYLKDKYGYKRTTLTCKSQSILAKARNKKERLELENSFTDINYHLRLNKITEEEDIYIDTLMGQYYYGLAAKKELYFFLQQKNIIN